MDKTCTHLLRSDIKENSEEAVHRQYPPKMFDENSQKKTPAVVPFHRNSQVTASKQFKVSERF